MGNNKDIFAIAYIIINFAIIFFVGLNPLKLKWFGNTGTETRKKNRAIKNIRKHTFSWNEAKEILTNLKYELNYSIEYDDCIGNNYNCRRKLANLMQKVSGSLEKKPLKIQRFSSVLWLRIAQDFSDQFSSERRGTEIDSEAFQSFAKSVEKYYASIDDTSISKLYSSLAEMLFITHANRSPVKIIESTKQHSPQYLINFVDELNDFNESWFSGNHRQSLDDLLFKWEDIAVEKLDPYLYSFLVFLETYRKYFNSLFNIVYVDKYQKNVIGQKSKKQIMNIKENISEFGQALLNCDLELQYKALVPIVSYIKNASKILPENNIIYH